MNNRERIASLAKDTLILSRNIYVKIEAQIKELTAMPDKPLLQMAAFDAQVDNLYRRHFLHELD